MQTKSSKKSRSRAEILAEIAALPPSVQGTISSYRRPRKNGPPAVYHNLQYTRGGKNHSSSIPVGKVSEFKAAAAAGRKPRDLAFELSLADANEIVSSESPLKNGKAESTGRSGLHDPHTRLRQDDHGDIRGRENMDAFGLAPHRQATRRCNARRVERSDEVCARALSHAGLPRPRTGLRQHRRVRRDGDLR